MATITKFEELDIWQLARVQTNDFILLVDTTFLSKDYELRNQMDASSGSVMDCIAEGFERSGNNEFKNFLVMAKGSNGEYRSQFYRCLDRKYISQEKFDKLHRKNITIGNKLMSSITYLQNSNYKGQSRKQKKLYELNNLELQTSNLEHLCLQEEILSNKRPRHLPEYISEQSVSLQKVMAVSLVPTIE